MEKYLFNFIDAECGLLINMYEEEYAEHDILPQILEITNRTTVKFCFSKLSNILCFLPVL
jgi:hypothetical protein